MLVGCFQSTGAENSWNICVFPGITLENIEEVKKLCTETRFERGVRKAALLMYWRLNPERKKSVTVSEMLENVEHVHAEPGARGEGLSVD